MADYNGYRTPVREPSFIQTVTPGAIRRSLTRASGYSSHASASTRSWVYSNQQNPPPPLVDGNLRRVSRPLPDPHQYSQTQQTLHAVNADPPEEEEEEEEYMNIDPTGPGLEYGYQTEGLGRGRRMSVSSPIYQEDSHSGGKSFVGGFVRGLKRFPKAVFRYGGRRRATGGTEGTATSATGMTGNTLPRYVSNPPTPVAGPSNVQYVQGMDMPVPPIPEVVNPTSTIGHSSSSRRRPNPSFRVTPPADILDHEDNGQTYGFPQTSAAQYNAAPGISRLNSQRATVMTYQDTAAGTISQPDPTPRLQDPHLSLVSNTPNPRVSPSSRAPTPVQSPPVVAAHPLPANDYMKMAHSPGRATRDTMTTITSYEPSFASELSPVQRFFHGLYHLPWVAHERVTVDYRPGIGSGGQSGGRGVVKKALASWYKGIGSGAANINGDIDLLSSGGGTGSKRTSGATNQTPVVSPTTGRARVRRSSSQQHRSSQHRHHTRKHRRRATVSTMNTAQEIQHQRNTSPLIPSVYPFQYPPYPYTYPAYPPPAQTSPGGSRSHRSRTYPRGGYTPYQPMPPPPPPAAPVYVLHSPARTSGSDAAQSPQVAQGQLLSPVYMQMQLVPGAFGGQDGVGLASPRSSPAPVPAPDSTPRPS